MITPHPQFFHIPTQMHGSGMVQNFSAMPSMYYPTPGFTNLGLHNSELHDHNVLIPERNATGPSDFYALPQATTLAEPLVNPGPRIVQPNFMGDSAPTASSSMGKVPAPEFEVEPPTQASVGASGFTFYDHLGSYYTNSGWDVNPAFNPDFNPSSMMGF